jgi:cytochrome c peroxidase
VTAAAARGAALFEGKANCAECHSGPRFTDAGKRLHAASETGMDPVLPSRGTTGKYRTTPLRGAWQHPPNFHDGSAATLRHVIHHYDAHLNLGLTESEKTDLEQYLNSL